MKYKGISLWQPWATLVIDRQKTIETRTHDLFGSLKGQDIFIHAAKKFDNYGEACADHYLGGRTIWTNTNCPMGVILGIVHVQDFRRLTNEDSRDALIDCGTTLRYGLILTNVRKFEKPIPCRGKQGIFTVDIEDGIIIPERLTKNNNTEQLKLELL